MIARSLSALVILFGASGASVQSLPTAPPEAGFETGQLEDGTELAIWYPAAGAPTALRQGIYLQNVVRGAVPTGNKLPLVVFSHGSGSLNLAHHDTATALARAGFVVVAVTHQGDNWKDHSKATDLALRSRTVSLAITYMLEGWPQAARLDRKRVGAFGYSAGGFAVLVSAGARADLSRIAEHCRRLPEAFECKLPATGTSAGTARPALPDARIKALVVAAPALGYTFDRRGMRRVNVPVQIWRAANDKVIPAPFYADAVRKALPRRPEFHDAIGAGHFDFMAPCAAGSPALPICQTPEFDRASFHREFNAAVVAFFKSKL